MTYVKSVLNPLKNCWLFGEKNFLIFCVRCSNQSLQTRALSSTSILSLTHWFVSLVSPVAHNNVHRLFVIVTCLNFRTCRKINPKCLENLYKTVRFISLKKLFAAFSRYIFICTFRDSRSWKMISWIDKVSILLFMIHFSFVN